MEFYVYKIKPFGCTITIKGPIMTDFLRILNVYLLSKQIKIKMTKQNKIK